MYECPAQASPIRDAGEMTRGSQHKKYKFDQQTMSMVLFAFLETFFLTGFFGGYRLIMPTLHRHGFFALCEEAVASGCTNDEAGVTTSSGSLAGVTTSSSGSLAGVTTSSSGSLVYYKEDLPAPGGMPIQVG